MKMIIVILKDHLRDALTRALTEGQYRVTGIASTGGFMRSGVVTSSSGAEGSRASRRARKSPEPGRDFALARAVADQSEKSLSRRPRSIRPSS